MHFMKKILLAMLFVWLPLTAAVAVKISNLYQAEVPVASQTYDLREQAVKDGLLQVLIKISGNTDIDKNPVIKSGLKKANYYVQDYSYSPDSRDASQFQLRISYEPNDVNRLLTSAKVANWGDNRPLTLVWLVVTDKHHIASIIGNEMAGTVFDKIMQESKNYGLPLIFPVMDVDDINHVSADDITSMNIALLQAAAKRYSPDALLIGRIEETGRGTQSEWQLIMKDKQWDFRAANNTTDAVIAYVMNQVNQVMSGRYVEQGSLKKATALWVRLEVNRITRRRDLARLIQYLKQVTNVQKIELIQVEGDIVELAIQVQGSLASFEQHLLASDHLVLKSEDDANAKLIYEWIK
jgi:hypothetical protein